MAQSGPGGPGRWLLNSSWEARILQLTAAGAAQVLMKTSSSWQGAYRHIARPSRPPGRGWAPHADTQPAGLCAQ